MSRPGYQRASSTNVLSGGIGAAIARNLAAKGASCILGFTSDKSTEVTEQLAKELQDRHGVSTLIVQADMGNPHGPAHVINTAKNHFSHPRSGKFQIDIIINNAAVSKNLPLEEVTIENYNWQYTVNVLGPILLMQAALPYLPNDRSGRVINLSSISSSMGLIGQTVYGGTKAAIDSMTRTWARELAERCTVNAVNPGPVATDMYGETSEDFQLQMKNHIKQAPLMKERKGVDPDQYVADAEKVGGRPGYDYEIAGVVGMLCSEDGAWCTGSVVCANGGLRFST